jgi:hypothetical protein
MANKYWLGKKRSAETRLKMSLAKKGKMPKFIPDNTGRERPDMLGENHWLWAGDEIGYRNLHRWVERHLGKASFCENSPIHIATRYHWANISGEYKRDLSDWRQLCPKCNINDGVKIPERLKGGYQLGSI